MKAFVSGALIGAVLVVAMPVVAMPVVAQSASGVSAASTPTRTRTLELVSLPGGRTTEVIPVGKNDHAVGDYFVSSGGPLVHAETGEPAGHSDAIDTILSDSADQSSMTARLSNGTIMVVGEFRHVSTSTLPVVGGTGAYSGVTGTVSIAQIGDTGKARLTFHLDGPA
jgi:hypothetical protein